MFEENRMTRKCKHSIGKVLKICLFYIILFFKCWGSEMLEILKGGLQLWIETGTERERRIKKLRKIKRELRKKWKDRLS